MERERNREMEINEKTDYKWKENCVDPRKN